MKIIESMREWLYRKRMIHPSPLLETLADAEYLICPKFYVSKDKNGHEMIYLFEHQKIFNHAIEDKTGDEALENHVHIFDNVKKRWRKDVKIISEAIARNLFHTLKLEFPNKKFVVYLDLNYMDSVIIRFHQIWENEDLYYDPKFCKQEYDTGKLIMLID